MKKYLITSIGCFIALCIFVIALSTSDSVDEDIRFADNGNIYMSQELCDAEDPDISSEMEKRLEEWWADVLSGEIDGKVICTN